MASPRFDKVALRASETPGSLHVDAPTTMQRGAPLATRHAALQLHAFVMQAFN